MLNALLLLLIVAGLAAQDVTKKSYSKRCPDGALGFAALSTLAALLFFTLTGLGSFSFSPAFLPYSAAFAAAYSLSVLFSLLAIREGPLSLSALLVSYSLLIPTFYGLIAWNEPFDALFGIGLLLLLISLLLIRKEGKGEEKRITPRWVLYITVAFVGNGACSTVQKAEQMRFDGLYKNEFMMVALAMSFAVLFVSALAKEGRTFLAHARKGALQYLLCGTANGAVNLVVLMLSLRMAASVMFPIISAGGILASSLLSVTVYKEKLSRTQWLGVLLGVFAIVALNL